MIQKAIVIGAGIGGLCTAVRLRQLGLEVTVYEQAPEMARVGAGLTLWGNAIRALRQLGLAEAVLAAGTPLQQGAFRNAQGHIFLETDLQDLAAVSGEPCVGIHRADLHRVLLEAVPADCLKLGAMCTMFKQDGEGVTVRFKDGRSDRADLLIGADGIKSIVRQQLFPQIKLRYSGYAAWRGIAPLSEEVMAGCSFESWGRGSRAGLVRLNPQEVYWFTTINTPAGRQQSAQEHKAFLQTHFADWHTPIPQLIAATPAEALLYNDIYDFVPFSPWSQGRITLVGDAAHATTPNMGQGACQAIESAVILGHCLEKKEWPAALRTYEQLRQPRTAWITNQSWRLGWVAQWENASLCRLRDWLLPRLPKQALQQSLKQAVTFESGVNS